MTIYNYLKSTDSENNKYPQDNHSIVETSDGSLFMILDSDDTKIDKSEDKGAIWSNIADESYSIPIMYYDRDNEYLYYFFTFNDGDWKCSVKYIDLSDDSVNTVVTFTIPSVDYSEFLDLGIESNSSIWLFGIAVQHVGTWSWGIWSEEVNVAGGIDGIEAGLGADPTSNIGISYELIVSDVVYILAQTTTNHIKLFSKDLTGGIGATDDFGANLNLPDSKNLQGISYDGTDLLYFVLKDTTDSKNYLYTYSLSGSTETRLGEYNVSLMLDRNTNSSNQVGFNLEKGFHLTSRYVYQIARTKGSLYQIADLTNVLYEADDSAVDGTIIAITDTYLFLKRTSNAIEVWEFQDFSDHYFIFDIYMNERDYPTAYCEYDSRRLGLGQGTFVQCIGNVRVKGSTSVDVKFEGYCLKPEQLDEEAKYLYSVELISPAYFDLIKGIDGSYTGDSDGNIDTLDDRFNYVTKGTYDDGAALEPLTIESEKKVYTFLDELAIGNSGTWGIRPKGVLDFVLAADDSGIDYDQSTPIWNVIISKRIVQYNEVTLKGAYVNGTLVQSDTQVNQANQDQRGPIPFDLTIAWLQTTANANTWATAILAMLSTEYTEVEFSVYDATNGFIPPTEQITLADSNKGITSAQYWINSLIHHDKTNITDYVCSSAVRWDDDDLKDKLPEDLSDQVGQVAGTVDEIYDEGITASGAWYLKTSGDTDDYLQFSTVSNDPVITIMGGENLYLKSEGNTTIRFYIYVDSGKYFYVKQEANTDLIASDNITIKPSGATNDYLYFYTNSNIAYLLPNEDKVHYLGSPSLSYDHVYSDDFDNTSPFKKFDDPLTLLKEIRGKKNDTEIDYRSLPEFVRSHSRDPIKHIRDDEGKIILRAMKDVVEVKGWSINRMCVFLYQACQKLLERIEALESS